MATITKCDYCGRTGCAGLGTGWIRVDHEPAFDSRNAKPWPQVSGDYCGYWCLYEAASKAAKEYQVMKENQPK